MPEDDRAVEGNRGTGDGIRVNRERSENEPNAEVSWERANPQGRTDWRLRNLSGFRLILWNFSVSGDELKLEHKTALRELSTSITVQILDSNRPIFIVGRASDSGGDIVGNNTHLARARAEAVLTRFKGYIMELHSDRFLSGRVRDVENLQRLERQLRVVSYGDSRPLFPNITPQFMANNRSVDIIFRRHNRPQLPEMGCNPERFMQVVRFSSNYPRREARLLRQEIESLVQMAANSRTGSVRRVSIRFNDGAGNEGDILIRACCRTSRGLTVELVRLKPESIRYYEMFHADNPQSPTVLAGIAERVNKNLVDRTILAPCTRFREHISQMGRDIHFQIIIAFLG